MTEPLNLDPELKEVLRAAHLLQSPGDDINTPAEQPRLLYNTAFGVPSKIPVKTVTNKTLSGLDGNEVQIRVYHPEGTNPRATSLPVLVFYHGGGFFAGSLDTHDDLCRNLGRMSGYIVIAVDYRLAPEHKFPAGYNDGYAAIKWAHDSASSFGGDASKLAVAGDSAGGGIAAGVCAMAQDKGGPPIALQVLMYPMMQSPRLYETKSLAELDNKAPWLNKQMLKVAYERLVATPADEKNRLLDLTHATSLQGVPPALVITAEFDPLRDEGELYAARLTQSGVQAKAVRCSGTAHGFIHFNSLVEMACAKAALKIVTDALQQAATGQLSKWESSSLQQE